MDNIVNNDKRSTPFVSVLHDHPLKAELSEKGDYFPCHIYDDIILHLVSKGYIGQRFKTVLVEHFTDDDANEEGWLKIKMNYLSGGDKG